MLPANGATRRSKLVMNFEAVIIVLVNKLANQNISYKLLLKSF